MNLKRKCCFFQVLDLCGDDTEAMKLKTLTEEQRLKSAIDNAR